VLAPQQSTVPFESSAQDVMPGEMAVTTTPDELDPPEEPGRDEPPVLWLHPTKTASDEQRLRIRWRFIANPHSMPRAHPLGEAISRERLGLPPPPLGGPSASLCHLRRPRRDPGRVAPLAAASLFVPVAHYQDRPC
jgi:hypothetical protein